MDEIVSNRYHLDIFYYLQLIQYLRNLTMYGTYESKDTEKEKIEPKQCSQKRMQKDIGMQNKID